MEHLSSLQRFDRDYFIFRTIYNCSQDQWDIYMIDPAYSCAWKPSPEICSIRPNHTKNTQPEPPTSKHLLSPVAPDDDEFPSHTHKKRRTEPIAEEDEVEQLLSSEPPRWRPKSSQRARSKSRQPPDRKPTLTIPTEPPLDPVQEMQDTDMEDFSGTPTPNKSQSKKTEKRKGTFSALRLGNIPHSSIQRVSMQMKHTAQVHSDQTSGCELNR